MFYRRKVLLALLQCFGGQLEKLSLQKLLFLFTTKQHIPTYDFIPFHYGSYSISANADLAAMAEKQLIKREEKHYRKSDTTDYINKLAAPDRHILFQIKRDFQNYSSKELMKFTYLNFSYYAINSRITERLLDKTGVQKVHNAKPTNNRSVLYTIGYEGISIEEYLNRLIKHDVRVLVDVRNNPLSRKFGFSKSQLKNYCRSLQIDYQHIPEVGIRSEYRKGLNSQNDYDQLFAEYRKTTLLNTRAAQGKILALLETNQRIALTCFEADACKCHRKHLANSISTLPGWSFNLEHL
jgi:uncharacterized protein (DUF488 family)